MSTYVPMHKFRSASVTVFILVLLLAGCKADQPVSPTVTECETFRKFYVVGHDWHTGIVVTRDDLVKSVMPLAEDFIESEYVEIGWGDEKFYQAETATPGLALQAILWPTSTVLHLVGITKPPQEYFSVSDVLEITVPQGGYENLLEYIAESFTRTDNNNINRLGPGLYGESWF